jgi:hypothetical protein
MPPHFFVWSPVESLVFEMPGETEEEMLVRIISAFDSIGNMPWVS